MAYVARYIPKGKATRIISREVMTSSCPTEEECLEALDMALQEVGLSVDSTEGGEIKIEFHDIPFILISARDWDGKLARIYGLTLREYKKIVSEAGLAGFSYFYRIMNDPNVPVEEKVRMYERFFMSKKEVEKKGISITSLRQPDT